MASGEERPEEEEEFEDIPDEGDAATSEVEMESTSAREKLVKLKNAVKEDSKKSKKEEKKKQEKKKEKKKKEEKRRKKKEPSPSPSSSSSSSSSSSENGDEDDEYYGARMPKRALKPKPKPKKAYGSISFNYDSLNTSSKDNFSVPVGKLPQFDGTNFAKWKHLMKAYLTGLHLELWNIVCRF